jgi:GcrA cell cycle regulator
MTQINALAAKGNPCANRPGANMFWGAPMPRPSSWTSKDIDELIALWREKYTESEIGRELRRTRSAVAGKIKRVRDGGAELDYHPQPKSTGPRKRIRNGRYVRKSKPPMRSAQPAKAPIMFDDDSPAPPDLNLCAITDLNDSNCHWPIGTPGLNGFHFCGAEALQGRPYCAHHCRIAYTPNGRYR